jgi:hypothetical protein
MQFLIRQNNAQAVCFHRLDVGGPLIDQHHVMACARHIGAHAAADCACSEYGYFLVHAFSILTRLYLKT